MNYINAMSSSVGRLRSALKKSFAQKRAGARAILASQSDDLKNRSNGQRLRETLRFETLLWEKGHDAIGGIDEAGMSPVAGPVSAAAVILKPGTRIIGIDHSKIWTHRRGKR